MAPNSSSVFSILCVTFLLGSTYVSFFFLTLGVSPNYLKREIQIECGNNFQYGEERSGKKENTGFFETQGPDY